MDINDIKFGRECINEQNYGIAISMYKHVIQLNPTDSSAYEGMGNAYECRGYILQAANSYNRAIQLNPNSYLAYRGMGDINRDLGNISQALNSYNIAIQLSHNDTFAFFRYIGLYYSLQKDYEKAIDAYKRAVQSGPGDAYLYRCIGDIYYYNEKDYKKATHSYKRAIRRNLYDYLSYRAIGDIYRDEKDYKKAIDLFEESIQLNPHDYISYVGIGGIYYDMRAYNKAINSYKKATRLNPQDKISWKGLHDAKLKELNVSHNRHISKDNEINNSNEHVNHVQKSSRNNMTDNNSKTQESHKQYTNINYLKELNNLIGLNNVKQQIRTYINRVRVNKIRSGSNNHGEIHLIFEGNPGTGKTTVARLFAKILYEYNIVQNPKIVEVEGSDLMGQYVGQTKEQTRKIVRSAIGGTLFIDEAYTLAHTSDNSYADEAVAELIADAENHRDDLVIIMAGYTKQMEDFLNNSNPGLASRFPTKVMFSDYSSAECQQIFQYDLKKDNMYLEDNKTKQVLSDDLQQYIQSRKSDAKHEFANARTVRNIYEEIKDTSADRLGNLSDDELESLKKANKLNTLTLNDIKKTFKKHGISDENKNKSDALKELNGLIGLGNVKNAIKEYIDTAKINHLIGNDKQEEIHLIFEGNPGTGKTTVARLFARALYDRGVIKSSNVIEVEGSDLMGQYVGQTKKQTRKIVHSAIGGTLFIDEAYIYFSSYQ